MDDLPVVNVKSTSQRPVSSECCVGILDKLKDEG
jgi:hypothetical protein